MDDQREHAKCAPAVLGSLIDLVAAAFGASEGVATKVDVDDIEQLVDVLHVLRPASADFDFFDGWLHMLRKNWSEAETVYRRLIERSVCIPASRGMLLQCLRSSKTFGWQDEARKLVEEFGDHEVGRLARTFLANDDLQQAYETARRTGIFVAPESTRELENGPAQQQEPAGTTQRSLSSDDLLMSMQYIRI